MEAYSYVEAGLNNHGINLVCSENILAAAPEGLMS